MSDGTIGLTEPSSPTKKLDTTSLAVGANTVQRERVQLAGAAAAELADVRNAAPAAGDYGVVARVLSDDIGAVADALVAAGAVGSLSAKLRRLTTDLAALLAAVPAALDSTRLSVATRPSTAAVVTLTIANGATTSDEYDARGLASFGTVIPAAFTGTAISFTVSDVTAGTFQPLYDITGALVSVAVTQGRSYDLPGELTSFPYWKIVSNAAEGASRSVKIVAKG